MWTPPVGPGEGSGVVAAAVMGTCVASTITPRQAQVAEELDPFMHSVLQVSRDRIFVMRAEATLQRALKGAVEDVVDFPPCNTYQRRILHSLGDYYRMEHHTVELPLTHEVGTGSGVRLQRTPDSRIPRPLLSELVPSSSPNGQGPPASSGISSSSSNPAGSTAASSGTFRVMKRDSKVPPGRGCGTPPPSSTPIQTATAPRTGVSTSSHNASAFPTAQGRGGTGRSGGIVVAPKASLEGKMQEYEEARRRIMGSEGEEESSSGDQDWSPAVSSAADSSFLEGKQHPALLSLARERALSSSSPLSPTPPPSAVITNTTVAGRAAPSTGVQEDPAEEEDPIVVAPRVLHVTNLLASIPEAQIDAAFDPLRELGANILETDHLPGSHGGSWLAIFPDSEAADKALQWLRTIEQEWLGWKRRRHEAVQADMERLALQGKEDTPVPSPGDVGMFSGGVEQQDKGETAVQEEVQHQEEGGATEEDEPQRPPFSLHMTNPVELLHLHSRLPVVRKMLCLRIPDTAPRGPGGAPALDPSIPFGGGAGGGWAPSHGPGMPVRMPVPMPMPAPMPGVYPPVHHHPFPPPVSYLPSPAMAPAHFSTSAVPYYPQQQAYHHPMMMMGSPAYPQHPLPPPPQQQQQQQQQQFVNHHGGGTGGGGIVTNSPTTR